MTEYYLIPINKIPKNPHKVIQDPYAEGLEAGFDHCTDIWLSKAIKVDLNKAANKWIDHEVNCESVSCVCHISFEDFIKRGK